MKINNGAFLLESTRKNYPRKAPTTPKANVSPRAKTDTNINTKNEKITGSSIVSYVLFNNLYLI